MSYSKFTYAVIATLMLCASSPAMAATAEGFTNERVSADAIENMIWLVNNTSKKIHLKSGVQFCACWEKTDSPTQEQERIAFVHGGKGVIKAGSAAPHVTDFQGELAHPGNTCAVDMLLEMRIGKENIELRRRVVLPGGWQSLYLIVKEENDGSYALEVMAVVPVLDEDTFEAYFPAPSQEEEPAAPVVETPISVSELEAPVEAPVEEALTL